MEMILSVLILALTGTACVQVLAAAKSQRQKARVLNHIQELTISAGEALEGWDGQISSFVETFGDPASQSETSDNLLSYFYDSGWNICGESSALYTMTIQLDTADSFKNADLDFYDSQGNNLYHLSVTFPFEDGKDEES